MEFEQNAKSKALKAKKRLELDNTKKANNEAQKSIKQKLVDIALSCESASLVERHCAALAMELDEARALLKTELGGAQVTSTDTSCSGPSAGARSCNSHGMRTRRTKC